MQMITGEAYFVYPKFWITHCIVHEILWSTEEETDENEEAEHEYPNDFIY